MLPGMKQTDIHDKAGQATEPQDGTDTRRRAGLQRVLPLWPHEIDDLTVAGRERVVRLLAKALREERCRGRRGHWAYDVARHAALALHYRDEAKALMQARRLNRRRSAAGAQTHLLGEV